MIARGTRFSRALAVSIVVAPLSLALLAFGYWAIERWVSTGAALAAEDLGRHEAEARATHAGFYGELGDAWRDYAGTEISGLAQEPSAEAAERAMLTRLEQLFERNEGEAFAAETLPRIDEKGAQRLGAEVRGKLPEAALAGFLEALETQPPFLFVDLMELKTAPKTPGSDLARVSVRLRVSGYRIKEADQ